MSLKRVESLEALEALVSNLPGDLVAIANDGDTSLDLWRYRAASTETHAPDDGVVKPAVKRTTQAGRWHRLKLDRSGIQDESISPEHLSPESGLLSDLGTRETNVLELPDNVAHEDSLTIGEDVYEVEIVNTDSTDDTDNDDFDSEDSPLVVEDAVTNYLGCTFEVGALIRIESEILRVSAVDGDDVTFLRAQSGTTLAAHADAEDVFIGDGVEAGAIAVGLVTTLTPAAFIAALLADLAEHGTEEITAEEIGTAAGIRFFADEPADVGREVAEDFTEAGNVWAAATFYGGRAPATRKLAVVTRVPNASEISLAEMVFAFPFEPVVLAVLVFVTATPGIAKAWDGAVSVDDEKVVLADGGSENLEETDTVLLIVTE